MDVSVNKKNSPYPSFFWNLKISKKGADKMVNKTSVAKRDTQGRHNLQSS